MNSWLIPPVWEIVAAEIRDHRAAGLGRLLTEDTVRFAAARALIAAGADPAGIRVEWPHPALAGSRVDLVIGGEPPTALIEFKYPREPNEKNAAWTMALGEVLKDLYRLAAYPGEADRLFVYAETNRLQRYMAGAARRYGLDLDADPVSLQPVNAGRLPTTAAQIIGADLAANHVTAHRLAVIDVDAALRLSVYAVDPFAGPPDPVATALASDAAEPVAVPVPSTEQHPMRTPRGVRAQILEAVQDIMIRSGGSTFTPAEVVAEMARRGSNYAESTIRTMITGHMCSNAPDNAGTTYDDLERVDRGQYRLARDTLR